ncbi:MAG: ClpXP protease specificity-enhancing factor [Gammaproteobacteria bacterium]|nr:ClpXP protease specificity-enhancing factor [Gammaproteobacteria bacterium]
MTTTRPYLIRAINEWACENDLTPHLLVNALEKGVVVPTQFINDGQIVLNISPSAVQGIELGNEWILFSARFFGQSMNIEVPVSAVLAIYARENGQGIYFHEEDGTPEPDGDNDEINPVNKQAVKKQEKPRLKVVK